MVLVYGMTFDHILIHYGEISLKGGNRKYFEDALVRNIMNQLDSQAPGSFALVKKLSGSIVIKLTVKGSRNAAQISNILKHTFGIVNFSFAASVQQNIETIKETCWELIQKQEFTTFRVTAQRSNKEFPITSEQLEREVGGFLHDQLQEKKRVDLKNPDCNVQIIIVNDYALVALEKQKGPGGLPVATAGKAMVLMSGGFDSPIAAWHVLKRGVQLRFIHFHSMPYTSRASIEKIEALVNVLGTYGSKKKILLVPFADIQKQIMMHCPERLRVVLYRRMMMRIAEALARREKCQALVTGDSIGQVASQTMENIRVVSEAVRTMPVFRPLIGLDKEEIMQKAKEVGTYDISKLPHDDCCTRLMPKNPETKAKLDEILEAEKNLPVADLVSQTMKKIEKLHLD